MANSTDTISMRPPQDLDAIRDRLGIARNMIACAWLANQGENRGELHFPVTETIARAMGDLDDVLETLGDMVREVKS